MKEKKPILIAVKLSPPQYEELRRVVETAPGQPSQSVIVRAALTDYFQKVKAQTGDSATMPPAA